MQEVKTCYIFLDIDDKPIVVAQYFLINRSIILYCSTYISNPKAFSLDLINSLSTQIEKCNLTQKMDLGTD